MEDKILDKYIVNEEIKVVLRGIARRIEKDISPEVFKDLLNIINEEKMTECYLDFLKGEYEIEKDIDYTDDLDFNPYKDGWYV